MTLNLNVPKIEETLAPRITVIGVGGAGGNAVNNMIRSNLEGVEFVVANTDAQAMKGSLCEQRIQLGRDITSGLGAGSRPDVGRAAAEESLEELRGHLDGANMVFITAGMGGGTGTGAAPVIARAAREAGILTVGVVTKPFQFEGIHRMRLAENGIQELTQYVDTLIIIPNQNLFRVANEKTTFADAFKMADDVLYSGVRGVTDLMVMPGLINLDFADIRSVMTEMGKAMMGTGEAEGDNRAIAAAEAAISNPLLDDVTMRGARGVLINITGGDDMTLFEVDEAANRIRDEVDPEANIIFGSTFDDSLNGRMRVSVVATGIDLQEASQPRPVNLSVVSTRPKTVEEPKREADPAPAIAARAAEPVVAKPAEPIEALAEAAPQAAEPIAVAMPLTAPAASAEPAEPTDESDAFIAPEPMRPAARPVPEARPTQQADPFKAAELANASADRRSERPVASARNKAYSLFARVTGAAKAIQESAPAGNARRPAREEVRSEPQLNPSATARPQAERTAQPTLTGLDSSDRLAGAKDDEDLLDIPAFLRRQAN